MPRRSSGSSRRSRRGGLRPDDWLIIGGVAILLLILLLLFLLSGNSDDPQAESELPQSLPVDAAEVDSLGSRPQADFLWKLNLVDEQGPYAGVSVVREGSTRRVSAGARDLRPYSCDTLPVAQRAKRCLDTEFTPQDAAKWLNINPHWRLFTRLPVPDRLDAWFQVVDGGIVLPTVAAFEGMLQRTNEPGMLALQENLLYGGMTFFSNTGALNAAIWGSSVTQPLAEGELRDEAVAWLQEDVSTLAVHDGTPGIEDPVPVHVILAEVPENAESLRLALRSLELKVSELHEMPREADVASTYFVATGSATGTFHRVAMRIRAPLLALKFPVEQAGGPIWIVGRNAAQVEGWARALRP